MARPRLTYKRERLRLDGYLPADDPLLLEIKALPLRTRFPTVMRLLRAGQALSSMPVEGVSDEELRQQVAAAKEILDAFVVE
jgi:hypothetical protein